MTPCTKCKYSAMCTGLGYNEMVYRINFLQSKFKLFNARSMQIGFSPNIPDGIPKECLKAKHILDILEKLEVPKAFLK